MSYCPEVPGATLSVRFNDKQIFVSFRSCQLPSSRNNILAIRKSTPLSRLKPFRILPCYSLLRNPNPSRPIEDVFLDVLESKRTNVKARAPGRPVLSVADAIVNVGIPIFSRIAPPAVTSKKRVNLFGYRSLDTVYSTESYFFELITIDNKAYIIPSDESRCVRVRFRLETVSVSDPSIQQQLPRFSSRDIDVRTHKYDGFSTGTLCRANGKHMIFLALRQDWGQPALNNMKKLLGYLHFKRKLVTLEESFHPTNMVGYAVDTDKELVLGYLFEWRGRKEERADIEFGEDFFGINADHREEWERLRQQRRHSAVASPAPKPVAAAGANLQSRRHSIPRLPTHRGAALHGASKLRLSFTG